MHITTSEPGPQASIGLRRALFFGSAVALSLVGTVVFTDLMVRLYGRIDGPTFLVIAVFIVLFSLLCLGFTMVLTGFFASRTTRYNLTRTLGEADKSIVPDLTAVVFPIYNEEVGEVFDRVRRVYLSLEQTGQLDRFEFFILSDSTIDDVWLEEEEAWTRMCRDLGAFGRIFYRHRPINTNSKSGNIADFCRGWGGRYSYMVVMDADSFVEGTTMLKLAQLMQKHPRIGIIQTPPMLVGAQSLFARIQQFASQVYGEMFTAGLNFWQGSEGNYWGHNAIIRVKPFTEYCGLPDLPGKEPFGGKILSHDFVEAALMRKAGWEVWLAWDLGGSFEQGPESLIAYAQRDRRWLQGNIQHAWLLFAKGLHPISKFHLATGILGYMASPLWFGFLFLSALIVYRHQRSGLSLVPANGFLNNFWPGLTVDGQAFLLLGLTAFLLLSPKILFLARALFDRHLRSSFGGLRAITASMFVEFTVSSLVAPVLMLFHTKFFLAMFTGMTVRWGPQPRGAESTSWPLAFRSHGTQTIIGILWTIWALYLGTGVLLWSLPVLAGLLVSIPLSRFTSSPRVGDTLRSWNIMTCARETSGPGHRRGKDEASAGNNGHEAAEEFRPYHGFSRAVVDPYVNAIHVSLLEQPAVEHTPPPKEVIDVLIAEGPASLPPKELKNILMDGETLIKLHRRIWTTELVGVAPWWRRVVTHYRR